MPHNKFKETTFNLGYGAPLLGFCATTLLAMYNFVLTTENHDDDKESSVALESEFDARDIFTRQRGPEVTEEVPPCVKLLEEMEQKYSFVGR